MKTKKKIFVGVSGGVDSSVSLYLLKKQGYDVTGVFIRTWSPDFVECTWRDERRDAMRVCAHLDVPFMECDAVDAYKEKVADYMINEYKIGKTPNPDIMCNREVKFGVFWDFAKSHGADAIATGHYARIESDRTDHQILDIYRGIDESKDQSYFLWTLQSSELPHIIFPVGDLEKSEVRKIAKKINLPTATKKDSQGVCFLGPIDMREFLSHYIDKKEGLILNQKNEIIGHHEGAIFLTIGERHGFTVTKKTDHDQPYYVVSKDIEKNTVTVSTEQKVLKNKNIEFVTIVKTVFRKKINKEKEYTAQIRYRGEKLVVKIEEDKEAKIAKVFFKSEIPLVASGQSIVFYEDNLCLGGGIVE